MGERLSLPYEDAAEIKTGISGWVCKTCRRFYGEDEHTARYCCAASRKCETDGCVARVDARGFMRCDPCQKKADIARWLKLEQAPWDGKVPLCLHDDDKFFFSPDDLADYLSEEGLKLEDVRLVICELERKPSFDVSDFLCDYLPDSMDLDGDPREIEKIVDDWIEKNAPNVWMATKERPTLESVKEHTTFVSG